MFCDQCGEENRNDRKFCSNCGAPLRDYTKPRENLLMPEDVKEHEEKVTKLNKNIKIFKILMFVSFLSAIILLAVSFFVDGNIQLGLIIASCLVFVLFFIFLIVKGVLVRTREKEINTDL